MDALKRSRSTLAVYNFHGNAISVYDLDGRPGWRVRQLLNALTLGETEKKSFARQVRDRLIEGHDYDCWKDDLEKGLGKASGIGSHLFLYENGLESFLQGIVTRGGALGLLRWIQTAVMPKVDELMEDEGEVEPPPSAADKPGSDRPIRTGVAPTMMRGRRTWKADEVGKLLGYGDSGRHFARMVRAGQKGSTCFFTAEGEGTVLDRTYVLEDHLLAMLEAAKKPGSEEMIKWIRDHGTRAPTQDEITPEKVLLPLSESKEEIPIALVRPIEGQPFIDTEVERLKARTALALAEAEKLKLEIELTKLKMGV